MRTGKSAAYILQSILALSGSLAWSQTLSERGVYERCYSKLVRTTPDETSDPYLARINSGNLSGAAACKALLALGKLESNGNLMAYPADAAKSELARKVLSSMHDLHSSWITVKTYVADSPCSSDATNALLDPGEPALFFTRALFNADYPYQSVVTSKDNLRAIRSVNNPRRSIFADGVVPGTLNNIPSNYALPGNGILLGVTSGQNISASSLTGRVLAPGETRLPTVNNYPVLQNQGGGILGSQAYLVNNFGDAPEMFPNLEKMPRQWAKSALKDILCRDLPVIAAEDAIPYAVCSGTECPIKPRAGSTVLPFRQSASCTQCHATMDQMIGVVRNLRSYDAGRCNRTSTPPRYSINSWVAELPALAQDPVWGYSADNNYRKHQPGGVFLFRDYNNNLVNTPITNLESLGRTIASLEDLYICAAKRYYYYFTGIDVPIAPMTPAQVQALPPDQRFFRNRVVNLGKQLKNPSQFNRDPLKLVQAIFDLPEYRNKDFGLLTIAGGN